MKDTQLVILGIDPGSQTTGYGAVCLVGNRIEFSGFGVIAPPPRLTFHERIAAIAEELEILFARVRPHVTVIEKVFLGKNADSAFKLGHARGVALAAAVTTGSQVVEYATRAVKKGITGNGGATKEQVQAVLAAQLGSRVFGRKGPGRSEAVTELGGHGGALKMDASDALALAFHHAARLEVERKLGRAKGVEL